MRVLILEPNASGHHASYLRWLVDAVHKKGWDVVIATTEEALAHPALGAIMSEVNNVVVHTVRAFPQFRGSVAGYARLIRREFLYWRMFKRPVRDVRAKLPCDLII